MPAAGEPAQSGSAALVNVVSPVSDSRNAFSSAASFLEIFCGLSLGSTFAPLAPPAAMVAMASSNVATLPSWKYGAVRATLRSDGVLDLPSSSALLASF